MTILTSSVNPHDPTFVQNHKNMSALVDDLRNKVATISQGGGAALKERHEGRGKLFVRDRISTLIDEGSPFLRNFAICRLWCLRARNCVCRCSSRYWPC